MITDGTTTLELVGGADKYLYKLNSEQTTYVTDYYDAVGGSTNIAISGEWRSVYGAYGSPRQDKYMVDTEVVLGTQETTGGTKVDCPVTVKIYNELGITSNSQISTASTQPEVVSSVLNKLYGKYLATEFTNKNINQGMEVLYWTARVKQTRGLK
jgi:hypothetical protein